jgi:hypothetical protein
MCEFYRLSIILDDEILGKGHVVKRELKRAYLYHVDGEPKLTISKFCADQYNRKASLHDLSISFK